MGNNMTQDVRALWLMLQGDGHLDSRDQAGTRIYAVTSGCKALPDPHPGGAS